jgi:hypothetical protein
MPALSSSAISWVEYDPATRVLHITFRFGFRYSLRGVPEDHYLGLLNAESPGAYFNTYLRGNY